MFFSTDKFSRSAIVRFGLGLTGALTVAAGLSAATLTVNDETGTVATLGIQSGNTVVLRSSANGNLTLTLDGYYVTISANADGAGAGGGDTGSGDTGGGDTGGGDTGGGDTGGGDTGGGDTGGGDTGGGDTSGGDTGGGDTSGGDTGGDVSTDGYCAGNDDDLADCRTDGLFDPWVAGAGEVPIWIRDKKVEVFAFSLPARSANEDVRYGYLQFTTPEAKRDPATQDVFRAWWSATPNGAVLPGGSCEWWTDVARGYMYWTQDEALLGRGACVLGTESRVLYLNFETRCAEARYKGRGTCDSENPQKSSAVYQFDVARYLKGY